jgi:tetratricopeptide (TPR) repeat protein
MSIAILERDEALPIYDEPLEVKTDEAFNQGFVLLGLGEFEEAIAIFKQLLDNQPDFYEAWYNLSIALEKLGRLDEALTSYDESLKIQPNFHLAWNNRGNVLGKMRRLDEALTSYKEAVMRKPDKYIAWHNLGYVLEELGQLEEAIASYNKALTIQHNLLPTWNNLGIALSNLGRHEEAIASFEEALNIRPDNYYAWNNRGVVLLKLGHVDEALTSFNKALVFNPYNADALYNKACSYALQGNVEQALENLQPAIALSPDKYREMAKTQSFFDSIREDERFQALIQEESDWEEGEIDESEWLRAAATNPAFDFLKNPEEDIYTLDDGKPFNAAEDKPTQAEILADIYRDRSFNPASYGLPDSVTLLRGERGETKIIHNVSWEEFENILAEMGDNRSSRVAYDRGRLEIMAPLPEHEGYKEIIGDLIKDLAEELNLDYRSFGSTRWKRQKELAGVEPDNCFYIQNESLVRGRLTIDLEQDPPPDLVLEIDITSKSIDRMPIYARLGVPELWRYDKKILRIYQLQNGKYNETDTSLAFGTFPVKQIPSFIEQNITASTRKLRQSFRTWVRQYLAETSQESG